MTHAYSTIAAQGVRRPLLAFTKVVPYSQKPIVKSPAEQGPPGRARRCHVAADPVPGHKRALVLHRHERERGASGRAAGRQDRHDRRPHRRLVLRLHARTWRPACGSATRRARSRCDLGGPIPGPAFGGGYPATIWRVFAHGGLRRRAGQVPADAVARPERMPNVPGRGTRPTSRRRRARRPRPRRAPVDDRRRRRRCRDGRRHHHGGPAAHDDAAGI